MNLGNICVKGVNVEALACTVPKEKFSVAEYAANLIDDKIAKRVAGVSGFESLRITPDNMTTSDLCFDSAMRILDGMRENNMNPDDISAIIFVSKTTDYLEPATAHIMQARLGLHNSMLCFDINEGCSGYVTGLFTASSIAGNTGKYVLLLGGDTNSKLTSPNDRATRTIFGDAGFACLLSHGHESEMIFRFANYGERSGAIIIENSGYRIVDAPKNDGCMFMDGAEIMNFTLKDVPELIMHCLNDSGIDKHSVTLFACHQANKLMLRTIAKKLGVSEERLPFALNNIGNTSSATIPLLLSSVYDSADLSRVMCAGFGVGLAIGLCITDFSRTKFYGIKEI